jgi:S-adenosylmethionine:tRNA ribosyltransferase-isomerase
MQRGLEATRGSDVSPLLPIQHSYLDYELPDELIAQRPTARREASRLLVVDREHGALVDDQFANLGAWIRPGDSLVVNETRVTAARLAMRRKSGGRISLLFVRQEADCLWRVFARPARRARLGDTLDVDDDALSLEIVNELRGGERRVRIVRGDLAHTLARLGQTPLPPYIRRDADSEDRERYQTVFARVDGAVAAPTAGLHLSHELLQALEARGIWRVPVLLHVGPGTFRPVAAPDPREHTMDEEYFEVGEESAARIRSNRTRGGRVIAVGTTTVRALESACDANGGEIGPANGWTRKLILPGYRFQAVDVLLTNFHLPRTTLLLLVAAFAGEELTRAAYAHAITQRYRFYSYGDAMLIV